MADWITKDDLKQLIKPGYTVYVGGTTNEPRGLLDQLDFVSDVHFIQQPVAAVNQHDLSTFGQGGSQETYFMTPYLEAGLAEGRVKFIPMQMRAIYDYLANKDLDVALLMAAKDTNGELRFGPNIDYVGAVLNSAKKTIVEVSDAFVAPIGGLLVGDSADYLFKSDTPVTIYPTVKIDPTSQTIGNFVASLIKDGDCIQTGIGAVPAAVLGGLLDKNDLGMHSGLIDDGGMRLIVNGNMNGARKAIDKGLHLTGMALGSSEIQDWLEKEQSVQFRSANYTHDISVIRQLDNFVSVNSALEIDLFGQINAEVAGVRQISGTGGSVDFMRASKVSKGGRSIVAMSSTARGGSISRIVPLVGNVTALRTDVDLVVTEFGIADLKNASLPERAAALIEIAHPDFKEQLRAQL
ncbi:MAG: hypothetical protein KUG79_03820 [Pseudomonadales bacterium]|nr:hypothetical protein [Pseudomonadales bacterium]